MRVVALVAVPLLAACSSLAPEAVTVTRFRNSQTGEVATGCGSMQGFAGPLHKAQRACVDAWKGKGWTALES